MEIGAHAHGNEVDARVTLATKVDCDHCDWCTRGLFKFCEYFGSVGFAGLPFGSPLVTCDTNAIHYREVTVFGAFSSSVEDWLAAKRCVD